MARSDEMLRAATDVVDRQYRGDKLNVVLDGLIECLEDLL